MARKPPRSDIAEPALRRALARIAARLSHEMHNPLASILANAQFLLRDGVADPSIRGPLEDIESSARRLAELVSGMLDHAPPGGRAARRARKPSGSFSPSR